MVSEEQLKGILDGVMIPGIMRSLHHMNLVRSIRIDDGKINISLASCVTSLDTQKWLKHKIVSLTGKLDGVREVEVSFIDEKPRDINEINNILAVMSGKGGVGKSLVTSLIAVALKRQGHEVGILDADITGPSIPRMFGVKTRPTGGDTGLLPVPSRSGIEIMSINLLLSGEEEAVIWRGPLIGRAITQFWEDVLWGKLDYLIVDLPPGTADAPLTVLQTLPVSGIIIVFTPQDLTAMVVRKAVNMAHQMKKPILGVVENMSYFYIPEIDKKVEIFGKSRGEEMAKAAGAPFLGQLPLDPELAKLCDEGNIELFNGEIVVRLGEALTSSTKKTN